MYIFGALEANTCCIHKPDCTGKLGLSGLLKATEAMRFLAYGSASDSIEKYVRTGSSTTGASLREFSRTAVRAKSSSAV